MTGPALNNNSFSNNGNNLRPFKPFGLNVKVPERTLKQLSKTIKENTVSSPVSLFGYLAKNDNVFSGKVASETDKLFVQGFNTAKILQNAEIEPKHKLDVHM